MNVKNMVLVGLAFLCITAFERTGFADASVQQAENAIIQQQKTLNAGLAQVTDSKIRATRAIENAQKEFVNGTITLEEFRAIADEENAIIAQAEQGLQQTVQKATDKRFTMQTTSEPKPEPSEHEKNIARRTVKRLIEQKNAITLDYEQARRATTNPRQRDELQDNYETLMKEFDADIYEQQLILGNLHEVQRKLFLDSVAAATVIAGGSIPRKYAGRQASFTPKYDKKFIREPKKSAQEAEEKIRLQAKRRAADHELNVLLSQQEDLRKKVNNKAAEKARLESEQAKVEAKRKVASEELDIFIIKQENLQRDIDNKVAEKAQLQVEEQAIIEAEARAAEQELQMLIAKQQELQRHANAKFAEQMRLDAIRQTADQELNALMKEQKEIQKELNARTAEKTKLEIEKEETKGMKVRRRFLPF